MNRPRDDVQHPTIKLRAFVDALLADFELSPRARHVTLDALVFSVEIKADASLLRLLLTSLIGAALRRAPANTSVNLVVSPRGQYTEFRIADEGAGLVFETRGRVFGAGAAGLREDGFGLTFCRAAAEANGGRLSVVETNPGIVVCLAFPTGTVRSGFRQADADGVAVGANGQPELPGFESGIYPRAEELTTLGARPTVLVVDDEPLIRRFVLRALKERGYETAEAESAESALEILRAQQRNISLLLSDVGLPGASGAELVRQARLLNPRLPALLMSASSPEILAQQGVCGEDPLLQKPFEVSELLSRIDQAVGRATSNAERSPAGEAIPARSLQGGISSFTS